MTLLKQWYGPFFLATLFGLVVLDVLSFLTLHTVFETLAFVLLSAFLVCVAIKHPEWVFPLALAEVISTSNGHSLNVELFGASVGWRMVLFAVLLCATLIRCMRHRKTFLSTPWLFILGLVGMIVTLAAVHGFVARYDVRNIYLDANGYVAFLYIWAAFVWMQTSEDRHRLFQAFSAGIAWISTKTLLFVFLFGHLHPKTLVPINTWIRDTRLGELTLQFDHVYRVFLQSQWFLVVAMLLLLAYIVHERSHDSTARIALIPIFAGLMIGLSRSFWVGATTGGVVLLGLFVRSRQMWAWLKRIPDFVTLKIASLCLLYVLIAVPIYGVSGASFGSLFKDRATQTSDVAIDSRKQLLGPLQEAIARAPIQGHGLGATVTYKTKDPKFIEAHKTDIVSTYAFEWGWHDMLVKFGIVGTAIVALLLVQCAIELMHAWKEDPARRWLSAGLLASLVALVVTHTFSPYINHPIGWMTVAFVVAMIPPRERQKVLQPSTARTSVQPALQSAVTRTWAQRGQ